MKIPTLALTGALVAAFLSAPVALIAAPVTVEVKYADLDLSTESGVTQLNRRIDDAAKQICSAGAVRTGTILPSQAEQQCRRETVRKLQERVAAVIQEDQRG